MNIRKLINKLETIALLSGEDQVVQIFCPEGEDWYDITCITYGCGNDIVKIYNDEL